MHLKELYLFYIYMVRISEFVTKVKELNFGSELVHLSKLIESHKKTADESIVDFLQLIVNAPDEFFVREQMPESWSTRSYSSAMESLLKILQHENIKQYIIDEMGQDEFDDVIEGILVYKRKYMNEYKKNTRQKKGAISDVINVDAEGIQMPEVDKVDKVDKVEEVDEVDEVGEVDEVDKVGESKNARIENIIDMLQKYINIETDEFKVLYLNIVKEKLVMLL